MASASSFHDSGERFLSAEMLKSIQAMDSLSFDAQIKMAEEISKQEANCSSPDDLDFEEQIRLAEELSKQEFLKSNYSSSKSFYEKHFNSPEQEVKLNFEVPDQIFEDQLKIAQKRKNAEQRKPFERDLRLAEEQSRTEANIRSGKDTSSDSDSGFASEDREFALALQKSCDPKEQESREQMELLLALQLSERENSSLEFSSLKRESPVVDYLSSSQGSNDPELWLYQRPPESNRQRIQDLFSSSSSSGSSSQELNDQILLKQLQEELYPIRQPLTPAELDYLKPFINPAVAVSNDIPDVKSLDEIEEEYTKSRLKKNSRKSPNSGSASPSVNGLSKQGSSSNPFHNSHLYPDLRNMMTIDTLSSRSSPKLSALSIVNKKTRSPVPSNGFYDNLIKSGRASPRKSPDVTLRSVWQTEKPCNSPKKSSVNLVSYSGAAKKTSSSNGYSIPDSFATTTGFGQSGNSGYRPIIVDGCNVAFQHGKNDRFSAKGLLIIYNYFVSRFGYTNENITIVNKPGGRKTPEDMEILEMLYKIDVLVNTVSFSSF